MVSWSKKKTMTLKDFIANFTTEDQCRTYWKVLKESNGVSCQKCGSTILVWRAKRWEWHCRQCKSTTTLRTGTIMEHSNLPFQKWFLAMYLMTSTKKGISALEMQRQLGMKRYEPVWSMMHKIRVAMGYRDETYKLNGVVEVDEAFVKTLSHGKKSRKRKKHFKRGRGSEQNTPILVMTESTTVKKPRKNRPSSFAKYVKIVQVKRLNSEELGDKMSSCIDKSSTIKTDGFRSYRKIGSRFAGHDEKVVPSKKAHKMLPCVHTMIGNLRRFLDGVLHHVDEKYLQNYLDEYCYKMNRRNFKNLIGNLFKCTVKHDWVKYG
jgi:transposase-like protein